MSVRLEWDGKPTQVERISLPFQTVETIYESRATRQRDAGSLLAGAAAHDSWRNLLIWGDNKLVMSSLLKEFAGQIKLIYIDPPFTPIPTSRFVPASAMRRSPRSQAFWKSMLTATLGVPVTSRTSRCCTSESR
jgi:hypothetical protein